MNEENEARDRARDAAIEAFKADNIAVLHTWGAPLIMRAFCIGYDAGYERGKAENNELLECPMCSAPNAFVISQADPADGYCRVEGKVHTIRVLLCECAVRAPGQNVCLRCMRPYNKDGSAMGGRYS